VQVGLQRRSSEFCREAVEFIRGGGIGKVTAVRAFHIQNEWPKGIGKPPDEAPPASFDWEAWLGPAPKVPYNKNRTFYRFRWFYHYSGGQLTNMGVHYLDLIQWALGHDAPTAVTAMGGAFAVEDSREIPDTLEVVWRYQNSQGGGALVTFTQINASAPLASARDCDVEFRGAKGALYLMGNGYEVVPDDITPNEFPVRTPLDRAIQRGWRTGQRPMIEAKKVEGRTQDAHHARNFLDCVRSRERCHCDIETGHRSTSATLLGNIAYQTKSYLEWDAKAERFTNNQAANKRLSYEYRAPYELPSPV
jgi:predicted dehydrogenase